MSNDETPKSPDTTVDGRVIRKFDPDNQHRVIRDRLHTFDIINERFARLFRISVFNLIRRNPDITVDSMRYMSYNGFSADIPTPTNINLVSMKPLHGTALIMFPPELVFMVVENLFGGDGRFTTKVSNESKDFTHTEQRIINRLLALATEAYESAWQSVFPIEIRYLRSEMQAKFASITNSPNDVVVATAFHLEVGNVSHKFHICIPYAMLEPVKDLLTNPVIDGSREDDTTWSNRMAGEIKLSGVELSADFVSLDMRIAQLIKLQKGDILPIELPETIIGKIDGVPVMECTFGTLEEHRALRVQHMIDHGAGHVPATRAPETFETPCSLPETPNE